MNARCALVALIGAPNAGKSTLLNALLGQKLAIVTPKPQTTRGRIQGVVNHRGAQLIFTDTPGLFDAKKTFDKAMVKAARGAADEADIVVWMVDASLPSPLEGEGVPKERERGIKAKHPSPDFLSSHSFAKKIFPLPQGERELIVILNKTDRTPKPKLLALAAEMQEAHAPERIFMLSALKGDGVEDLKDYLALHAPEGHWLYPEDHLTDMSERDIAAELTREQLFFKLHEELPYGLMVETEKWEEFKNGEVKIHQAIIVERESHKKIILGAKGAMLKTIGEAARREITRHLGRKAHLFLFVKVREGWKKELKN